MFFISRLSFVDQYRYRSWLRILGLAFLFSLAINIAIWLLIALQIGKFSVNIPLHYNIYFGIDYYGSKYQLFFMPGLGLAVVVLNFFISFYFVNRERLYSYFLIGSAIFIQILLLISTLTIISSNLARL